MTHPGTRTLVILAWIQAAVIAALLLVTLVRSHETPEVIEHLDRMPQSTPAHVAPGPAETGVPHRPAPPRLEPAQPPSAPVDPTAGPDVGIVLHGTVRSATGGAPIRARITWRLGEEGAARVLEVDSSGHFAGAGFVAGSYRVDVTSFGFAQHTATLRIEPQPRLQRHEFLLEPQRIVRVALRSLEGVPLQELGGEVQHLLQRLDLVVAREVPPPMLGRVPLGASGRLRLPSLAIWNAGGEPRPGLEALPPHCLGYLLLQAPPPLQVAAYLGATRLACTPLADGQPEVELRIDPATLETSTAGLRFRLLDGDSGAPVTRASISLGPELAWRSRMQFRRGPDADGNWSTSGLAAGVGDLVIASDGYATLGIALELRPKETLDLGELRLQRAAPTWTGSVLDESGAPVSASIEWRLLPEGARSLPFGIGTVQSDTAGAFQLQQLGAERYLLFAIDKDRRVAWRTIDAQQPVVPIELRLQPTHLLGFDNELPMLTEALLVIRDGQHTPIWSAAIRGGDRRAGCRVPSGRYSLEVLLPGQPARTVPVSITEGGLRIRIP